MPGCAAPQEGPGKNLPAEPGPDCPIIDPINRQPAGCRLPQRNMDSRRSKGFDSSRVRRVLSSRARLAACAGLWRFLEQCPDQSSKVVLVLQISFAHRLTLRPDHASAVDHHDLWNTKALISFTAKIAVDFFGRCITDRVADCQQFREVFSSLSRDMVVKGHANGLEPVRSELPLKLRQRLGHPHAMGTVGNQKINHHYFAGEA